MALIREKRKGEKRNIKILAKEMTTFPPLLLRNLKFSFLESGEITPTQIAVILNLSEQRGPIKMSELARIMSSSMPTMTGIIARLVEKGVVERGEDETDRRIVTVKLSENGQILAHNSLDMIEKFWSSIIAKLEKNEREDFIKIIRKIKNLLSGEMKR
jgi:DNA-binding MarR family transcriptional regulator